MTFTSIKCHLLSHRHTSQAFDVAENCVSPMTTLICTCKSCTGALYSSSYIQYALMYIACNVHTCKRIAKSKESFHLSIDKLQCNAGKSSVADGNERATALCCSELKINVKRIFYLEAIVCKKHHNNRCVKYESFYEISLKTA